MKKFYKTIKNTILLLIIVLGLESNAQDSMFVIVAGGDLYTLDLENCTSSLVGKTNGQFGDIAITPNGMLWGIGGGVLYKINPQTADTNIIGYTGKSGVTLVELNDTTLLMEYLKDLYKIDTRSASTQLVGTIGYQASGDLTWIDHDLYLISAGILIKIELDAQANNILKVTAINSSSNLLPSCEGLASAEFDNEYNFIIGFNADDVYKICPIDGSYSLLCSDIVPNGIPGGAAKRLQIQSPIPKTCIKPEISEPILIGDTCFGSEKSFEFAGTSNSPYFKWSFGDSLSGSQDTITYFGMNPKPFPKHLFSKPGQYEVCLEFYEQNKVLNICSTFNFISCCAANSIQISSLCLDSAILLSIEGDSIQSVEWKIENKRSGFTLNKNSSIINEKFTDTGTYFVNAVVNSKCGTFELDSVFYLSICDTSNCVSEILSNGYCEMSYIDFNIKSNTNIKSVLWKFGDSMNRTSNSKETSYIYKAGKYIVSCVVETNCGFDTLYKSIEIIDCFDPKYNLCKMYIPNAITPNNDPINQFFEPWSECPLSVYQLKVFNRWGEMIFESNNSKTKWDGIYKNEPVEAGMYYYIFTYKFEKYQEVTENGYIQLIR